MNYILYLSPFIISFMISVVLTSIILWFCHKFQARFPKRADRNFSNKTVCRFGGVAIIFSFVLTLLVNPELYISPALWGVIIAGGLILFIGIWDDFHELEWKKQLFFQIAVAIFIFIIGIRVEYITNPAGGVFFLNLGKNLLPSLFFVIVWVVLMMNATNWIDGVDGLSGGITFFATITIFFLSLKPEVNQPPVGIISLALSGSLLGFLLFNFYPARILAGTSGSMFMGFMLAVLAIFAGAKIATALLVMAVPVIDAIWVIFERLRNGDSIFHADKRHLHFKLLDLGWSAKKIAALFYLITLAIAIIALNTRAMGKLITVLLVLIIMSASLLYINKKLVHRGNI
jgi:UDP-GlcNAc:undecaprenyl-phosphate/decaprenyl-phosphate GlcNAc-1-phosphate transferase